MEAVPGIPMVQAGDSLPQLIGDALQQAGMSLVDGDILVISSKIISKAEGRFVDLKTVTPSPQAEEIAQQVLKDPRVVELVLQNSAELSRIAPHVLIVRHKLGFTSANAGIDASNVGLPDTVLLLPADPDHSAAQLRDQLQAQYGISIGIIISDTHGRPFRLGNLNVAIGIAGVPALLDQRGQTDLFGRVLHATITPFADELAAASGLIAGQADEAQPVVLIRGVQWIPEDSHSHQLLRSSEQDLYR